MNRAARKAQIRGQQKVQAEAEAAATSASAKGTRDSFQNVAARLGIGTDNLNSASSYGFNPVTRNRVLLEFMYRGSWLVGQAVDCVAEDMVRAGIDLESDDTPEDLNSVQKGILDLGIWSAIEDTIKWSRLYGGAIAVFLVDGQDVSTPLIMERVGKGQFKGLLVLDRWMVQPTLENTVAEFGPDLGMPVFYNVTANAPALSGKRIHYSRVIRMDGVALPYWQRITENGWGLSVLERLYDRMVAFDSTSTGVAQLVFKAHLRTVKVENLREILAAGGASEQALIKQFEMIRQMQTNEGLTLLDAKDDFEAHSFTFSGLSDVLVQFAQQISGSLQIPLVRLFGQSPAGLNSTGESDLRTYYDMIAQQQGSKLERGLSKVVELTYRTKHGRAPPDGFGLIFNPLWQMSDTEKATIAVGVTNAVTQAFDSGLVDRPTAMKELRQSSDVTGVWSNITDEDIKVAEADPPPPPETAIIGGNPDATASAKPDGLADVSLNGAQVASMIDLVNQVTSGSIPRESAMQILTTAFPIDVAHAEKIMGNVGRGFKPAPEEKTADVPSV